MSEIDSIILNGTTYELAGMQSGLSEGVKVALLQIAQKVVYVDEHGQDYYDDLYDALYPPADLVSISAVYTQSGTVYDTDTLDSLKPDLVVTAHYSDQTTQTVTTYTLSGTLAVGTSTVTVAYGGKATTFNVTVSQDVNSEVLSFGTCESGNGTSIRFNGTTFEDQSASNEWQVKSTIAASRISIVWDNTEADAFQITIGQRDANGDPYKVSNLNRYSSNPVTDGSAFTSSIWRDPTGLVWTAISGGNIEITLPTTGLVLVAARPSSGTGEASTNARMATWLTDNGLTITAYR